MEVLVPAGGYESAKLSQKIRKAASPVRHRRPAKKFLRALLISICFP
jgi:hypothetical protein